MTAAMSRQSCGLSPSLSGLPRAPAAALPGRAAPSSGPPSPLLPLPLPVAVPPPSATCGRARRSGAGRAGGGLGRPPAPNAANPRRPGPGHKSAGSRRGCGRSWREWCPGCLGVGSPAGPQPSPPSPSASSGPPPRPRCCFGTRSRSTTTSTPPAATCGESRRERGFARRKKKNKKKLFLGGAGFLLLLSPSHGNIATDDLPGASPRAPRRLPAPRGLWLGSGGEPGEGLAGRPLCSGRAFRLFLLGPGAKSS